MKKINIIFYVIGTICILMAIYIIYDKYFDRDIVSINEEEEIELLNDKLVEIGSPLGWVAIVNGIDNQDDNGSYNISFNEDLFNNYSYRQLFVMEYILSNTNNYDLFVVLDMDGNVTNENVTSEFTYAYILYDDFNGYYKSLFGEDFDIDKAKEGYVSYKEGYVYYDNRRAGSNGVYVSIVESNEVEYRDSCYVANATVVYSTRASELLASESDVAEIRYDKDINGNIKISSFSIKDR